MRCALPTAITVAYYSGCLTQELTCGWAAMASDNSITHWIAELRLGNPNAAHAFGTAISTDWSVWRA